MTRILAHVDMDAFFTAVEEREHPAHKGKPVVVGADPKKGKGRGVVSTSNYKAREFGIFSALPISIAYRKCPDAVFLPVNMPLYEKVSARIMKIFKRHAPRVEVLGIDEAFLDLTLVAKNYAQAKAIAIKIKQDLLSKEKLTCSIGLGPNKLVTKIASDFEKPNGLTIVKPERVLSFLRPLAVRKLYGVGPKTEARLHVLNVKTVHDLAKVSKKQLVETFGKFGAELYGMARGEYDDTVVTHYEIKSLDREHTFEVDAKNPEFIYKKLKEIATDVHTRVLKENVFFRTVNIKARYSNFKTFTRARTLKAETQDAEILIKTANELLAEFVDGKQKLRLIGVRVSKFEKGKRQKTLV